MPDYSIQRRLAAEILGVGESRIWISPDPEHEEEISQAVTRNDVRRLIVRGLIKVKPEKGNSHTRWLERKRARSEGKRRGHGRRKGALDARVDSRERWIATIRKIRRTLKWLRDRGVLDRRLYRKLYRKAKGGAFKSTSDLRRYMAEIGVLKGGGSG
ncbi:MAG: 50S ribosomal protein L19e [Acidilobaceae archaeon]|jgi:large subunit ribosomal protein L19e|nr:50S ribosomal protein L19e [Desulfurococcales archaeon]